MRKQNSATLRLKCEKKKYHKCEICEYAAATLAALMRHVKAVHDNIKDPIIRYFIFIILNNDNMKYLGQTMR